MAKAQINFRASSRTAAQLSDLRDWLEENQTQIIARAIDALWEKENRRLLVDVDGYWHELGQVWISCANKLPEIDQPVWLMQDRYIWIGAQVDDGVWSNAYHRMWYNNDLECWECDADLDDDYQPDYWMPLPLPPQELK